MEEDHNQQYIKWGIVAITALFSIFLLYLNILSPYLLGDDLLFQLKLPEDGIMGSRPISSLSDLIESQTNFYNNYHYRIFNHTVLQVLLLMPPLVFDVLNVIVFLLLPVPLLKIKHHDSESSWWVGYLTLLTFVWICHISLGWAYFSTTGSLNYTWMLLPQLWYIFYLIKYLQEGEMGGMLVGLALVNALGNENASVMLCTITLMVLFWKRKTKNGLVWLSFAIITAGGIFMLLSPSIAKRMATQDFMTAGLGAHLIEFSKRTMFYLVRYSPVLLLLLCTPRRSHVHSQRLTLLIVAFMVATLSMVLAPLFEARSAVLGLFILMMLMVSMTNGAWKLGPLVGLTIVGTILCFLRLPHFQDLSTRHLANHSLLEANRGNDGIVYVDRYCDKTKRNYLLCHEISEDPAAFDNRSISAYYDIGQVALSEKYSQGHRGKKLLDSIALESSILNQFTPVYLTDGCASYIRHTTEGLDVVIKSTSVQQPYFILRGKQKNNLKHLFFNFLPASLRLSFLDYLEDVITNSQPNISTNNHTYNYLFVPDSESYDYLLLSQYDLSSHTPIGKVYKIGLK